MGHPSPTAKQGNIYSEPLTKGLHRDLGPYKEAGFVYCKQCGFICNTSRDARNFTEYAGETITSGNYLTNGSFEDWTGSSLNNWTVTGTVTKTSTSGYFDKTDDGSYSISITRSGSTISLTQSYATPSNLNSKTVSFRAKVKCSTKDVIRLGIKVGSTTYYSNYNRGQEMFEDISVVVICPASVSSIDVYIYADNADGTAYVDSAMLMSNGNATEATGNSGCPHCSSYNYY